MPINLADLSPQQEVAAIYVGYFELAPDPFGFNFWTQEAYPNLLAQVQGEPEFADKSLVEQEHEVLARIAQDFARQPLAKAEYPFFQTPSEATAGSFLNDVYLNLFNRPIDTGPGSGQEFWTPLLLDAVNNPDTAAFSVGEIILEIIKGAQEPGKSVVLNKIEAAIDWTENAAVAGVGTNATNYVVQDLDTGVFEVVDQESFDNAKALLASVDETAASVAAAKAATDAYFETVVNPPVEPTVLELGSNDLNPGETYSADTVILNLTENPPTSMTVVADTVIVRAENQAAGDIEVDVSNWTVGEFIAEDGEVNVSIVDIQGTDVGVEDQTDPTLTTTFNYDQQAAAGATSIGLSINEVYGGVAIEAENFAITGDGIEEVTVSIDDPSNIESVVRGLTVEGIDTLNVTGGNTGNAFTITEPLDAGLMTFDGSTSVADLSMNFSDSTTAITVMGGIGDDTFDAGNTLGSASAQDTFMGGEGADTLLATFTGAGNRKPISTGIETFVLDFQNNAQLDLEDVDDMHTIEIANVDDDQGVEIQDADSTFDTLLITGNTGGSAIEDGNGNNDWEIGYADIVDDENDQDSLTVIWQNNTGQTQAIDEFYIDRAEEVTFIFDGTQEMFIDAGFDLGFNTNGGDDEEVTEVLTIINANDGDGWINTPDGMDETDRLEEFYVETQDSGDLWLSGTADGDFLDDVAQLEEIGITASTGGNILLGDIGDDGEEAVELRNINIVSAGANITVGEIEGNDEANNDGASVSEVNITADDDAIIAIQEIEVEEIETMTVVLDDDSVLAMGPEGIDMDNQGGTLTVSGDGQLNFLNITDEAFETMDFSGLTESNVATQFFNALVGSNVIGTDQDDTITAGQGDDTIDGGDGNDFIDGQGGDDTINGGGGNDTLLGWFGNDIIDGGAGNDFIAGEQNDPSAPFGDIMTGGAGNDTFYFDLAVPDTGKSTNNANQNQPGQDVITDFTFGGDTIQIDNNGATLFYQILVYNDDGFGNFGTDGELINVGDVPIAITDPVKIVVRVGDYNENGTFNFNSDGEDLQVLFDGDNNGQLGVFQPFELVSSFTAFNAADYEIGLVGAASDLGSISTTDFVFV